MNKIRRINWVSEVQSKYGRRALLIASYPAFVLWGIVASILKAALYGAGVALIAPLFSIVRYVRILTYSARLRWRFPKPRGKDDWCVAAVDAYIEHLDAPRAEVWTAALTATGDQP